MYSNPNSSFIYFILVPLSDKLLNIVLILQSIRTNSFISMNMISVVKVTDIESGEKHYTGKGH